MKELVIVCREKGEEKEEGERMDGNRRRWGREEQCRVWGIELRRGKERDGENEREEEGEKRRRDGEEKKAREGEREEGWGGGIGESGGGRVLEE